MQMLSQQNSSRPSSVDSNEERPSSGILSKAARKCAKQNGWICQEYMLKPLLVQGRKFDIRVFVGISHSKKGGLKGYIYNEAYIRTSCKKYSLTSLSDRECHLTNDAIQKKAKNYGKFESANKLSLEEWQETINADYPSAPANVVRGVIWPQIKKLTSLSLQAVSSRMEDTQINKSFELLGYDFMIDDQFVPTIIEVNSNPCLELCCPLLENIIGGMIHNLFRLCVDPHLPPPKQEVRTKSTQAAVEELDADENLFEQCYP
jgi:hypothetical protein